MLECLIVVESEGGRAGSFASRLAASGVRAEFWVPSDRSSPPPHEAVLLPSLSLTALAKLACLLWDTPLTRFVGDALLAGRTVAFFRSGVHDPAETPAGMREVVDEYRQRLERFGMTATDEETWFQGKTRGNGAAGTGSRARPVITEEDIRALRAKGEKTVRLEAGSIVTPLARDVARELGIELVEMTRNNGAPA